MQLAACADVVEVDVLDPGEMFALAASGIHAQEDRYDYGDARFDLIVAIGTLDTVNDLGATLLSIRRALRPGGAFIGVIAGGDSLPALRRAMLSADQMTGPAAARTHPRIAPATLAGLLAAAGFVMPVVDVDRVTLRYDGLPALVRDLRAMGASNMLTERAPARGRHWAEAATAAFAAAAIDGRTEERIDLIHFLGWSAPG
jgi:SAM-dependent methyltransferase